jgi:hypothetical protein
MLSFTILESLIKEWKNKPKTNQNKKMLKFLKQKQKKTIIDYLPNFKIN